MMSSISNVDQVLAEMRRLTAAAQAGPAQTEGATPGDGDFSALLKQSIDQVNAMQQEASKLSSAFSTGDPSVDVTEVMIALQKAGVAFQAMTEVRNRLVTAYQDVMSMPV
jgi:flagellar hook-basal body complex protein FliE